MTAPFRLYGAELSPFAVKVRDYLRFKGLAFEWLPRSVSRQDEFARYAKLPLTPVLVDAEETALQDSTPTIETLEARYPEPSILPDHGALKFLSALLEDYADEWLSKAMFHYRWSYPEDQASAARRTIDMLFEGAEAPEGLEDSIKTRMASRLHHVGASGEGALIIEASFTRLLGLLDAHLSGRNYLFGGRPSLADFGLAAQLGQLLSDPTPGALIRAQAPHVVVWIERMDKAEAGGAFETLDALAPSLSELLRAEIAGAYLPWMAANARAVGEDRAHVQADVGGGVFAQKPQRYAAKAYQEIRRKRSLEAADEALAALLANTGCDVYLQPTPPGEEQDFDSDNDGDDNSHDDEGEA